MSEEYRPAGFRLLPTVVKHLLIINAICYLAYDVLAQRGIIDLNAICGIYGLQTGMFRPWQPLTYMFMHATFDHLFFNMFALWMFGSVLENHWGARRFLFYYLICGIGAGLLNMFVFGRSYSVGASGAVYGLLLAFGMTFPNVRIYILIWMLVIMALTSLLSLWNSPLGVLLNDWSLFIFMGIFIYSSMTGRGVVGIKAKWMVVIYVVLELYEGIFRTYDGIGHFAHLAGMLVGLVILLIWKKKGKLYGDQVY